MAIKYLNLYTGSDSNDGLTAATPKLTINAATALVTSSADEIRVRGIDSLFTDIGSWTWVDKTTTVVRTGGDYTALAPAGSYICKTTFSNNAPEIYKVASIAYAGGNTTITLSFADANGLYYNETSNETVPTSVLSSVPTVATQSLNKAGYTSGSGLSIVRSKISGGWDSTYTTQNTFTVVNNTGVGFCTGAFANWEFSYFIGIGYTYVFANASLSLKNGSWINHGGNLNNASNSLNVYQNLFIQNCTANNYLINTCNNNTYVDNFKAYNLASTTNYIGFLGDVIITMSNCRLMRKSNVAPLYGGQNGTRNSSFTNCYFYQGGTYSIFANQNTSLVANNLYNSTIDSYGPINQLGLLSGCTINYLGVTNNQGMCSILNGISQGYPAPVFANTKFNLNKNSTGNFISAYYGKMYNCTGVTLGGACTSGFAIYNTIGENIGYNNITSCTPQTLIPNVINVNCNSYMIYESTGNTKFNQYGFTQLSTNHYSGKTGNYSVKHVVCTNTATCDFNNVDFVINASSGYTLSFYAKGSGSYTLNWNIFNGGQYLYAWQTQAITSGSWTHITKSILAADWEMNGTATLVIRIPSQAKGTYALIDYITLT